MPLECVRAVHTGTRAVHTSTRAVHTGTRAVHTSTRAVDTSTRAVHTSGRAVHISTRAVHTSICGVFEKPIYLLVRLGTDDWLDLVPNLFYQSRFSRLDVKTQKGFSVR